MNTKVKIDHLATGVLGLDQLLGGGLPRILVPAGRVAVVREVDTVCRYGGDEIDILLSEISQPDDASRVASKY